jgi:hypothetical protein
MTRRQAIALGLALGSLAGAAAGAEDAFVIPIGPRTPLELGTAWSAANGAARSAEGTCIESEGTDHAPGGSPSYSLVMLSRVGGRLVLGVYVSAPLATETLRGAKLTDAARRTASAQADQFRSLCGDGFIGAVTSGASYVAEIEVDPRDAARAASVVSSRLGTTSDPDRFREALESVTAHFRVVSRELPGGSHAAATAVEPAALVRRALALPGAQSEASARPYLAVSFAYPSDAFAGVPIEISPGAGREREAEQVFLWDRRGAGVGSASRAAELRKAQSHPSSVSSAPAALATLSPAPSQAAEAERSSPEGAAAQRPSAASSVPPVPAPLRSNAALVFQTPDGREVYATTEAPPGVYAEPIGHRVYWVPGAAEGTPAVKDAIHAAAAGSAPARGTTIQSAASGVVMTDAAPIAGVHSERAGALHAWIAGVATPSPAQREALAAAIRAQDRP